jgi:hypothetical protein
MKNVNVNTAGMPRQKVSVKHPKTGAWVIGILFPPLGLIMLAHSIWYHESYLKKVSSNDGGIGYHETYQKGKVIQNTGKFSKA